MSRERERALARWAAFHNHRERMHPEAFEVCPHDDCVLVRIPLAPVEGSALLEKPETPLKPSDEAWLRAWMQRGGWSEKWLGLFRTFVSDVLAECSAINEGTLAMAVHRLGGTVEGRTTERVNFLQRIDELVSKEARLTQLATLPRYRLDHLPQDLGVPRKSSDGQWVKWEDVRALLADGGKEGK